MQSGKKIIFILFLFSAYYGFSQRDYHFDYLIEYERTYYKEDSLKVKVFYLTNSKNNSYFAEVRSFDNENYKVSFKHQDKLYADVLIPKTSFSTSETIVLPCETIRDYSNSFKNVTKIYDYIMLKDTLLNQKKHLVYKLESTLKLKKKLRKGAGTNIYIIENSTSFHLPILTHPTAYEKWKRLNNLPNGIFKEIKFVTAHGEDFSTERLIKYVKSKRKIMIPQDCEDYP